MIKFSESAAVLWTGGKDSSLALYEAKLLGYKIVGLITFVPREPVFLAHPINFMKYQAEALGLTYYTLEIDEPFKAGYEKAIYSLRKSGIATLITGDIAEVDDHPNWIRECGRYSGVNVLSPLWGCGRYELINRILSYKFKVIFSCVKKPWFTDEWLGRKLDISCLEGLLTLSEMTGLDICGEQGEYHTLTLDGPIFQKSIVIDGYSKKAEGSLMYIDIQRMYLKNKLATLRKEVIA